jgi:hypothetical protein
LDIPTLVMPYGLSVPLPFASAGMKRVLALSYLLARSWEEHRKASAILGQKPTSQIIFLVDEIESLSAVAALHHRLSFSSFADSSSSASGWSIFTGER